MPKRFLVLASAVAFALPVAAAAQADPDAVASSLAEVDQGPRRLGGRALRYPPMLLAAGIEGEVVIRYIIGANGRADRESIEIVESPSRAFAQAATDFVRGSRFQPAQKDGKNVSVAVEQVIRFDARSGSN